MIFFETTIPQVVISKSGCKSDWLWGSSSSGAIRQSIAPTAFGFEKLEVFSVSTTTVGSLSNLERTAESSALGFDTPTKIIFLFALSHSDCRFAISVFRSAEALAFGFGKAMGVVVIPYRGSSIGIFRCTGPLLWFASVNTRCSSAIL